MKTSDLDTLINNCLVPKDIVLKPSDEAKICLNCKRPASVCDKCPRWKKELDKIRGKKK